MSSVFARKNGNDSTQIFTESYGSFRRLALKFQSRSTGPTSEDVQSPLHAFVLTCGTQRREGAKKVGMQAQFGPALMAGGILVAERFLPSLFFVPFVIFVVIIILPRQVGSRNSRLFAFIRGSTRIPYPPWRDAALTSPPPIAIITQWENYHLSLKGIAQ